MIKYWRLLLLIITVIGALFAVGLKAYPYGRDAVEVLYVSGDSPASGILEQGNIITYINGEPVRSTDDWNRLIAGSHDTLLFRVNAIRSCVSDPWSAYRGGGQKAAAGI